MNRPSPLRIRRLMRGLRLRDLEYLSAIPESTLSRIERGELPLLGGWLTALARVYATDPVRLREEMESWAAGANRATDLIPRLGGDHAKP